jgi:hypothetical protein
MFLNRKVILLSLYIAFAVGFLMLTESYQLGDRVITTIQSQHVQARSPWHELPITLFPRFGIDEKVIVHASIPKDSTNTTEHRINTGYDFKATLAFDYNRHSVPWITIYDKEQHRTLKKLLVTFVRDEFEIVKVHYDPICKSWPMMCCSLSCFIFIPLMSFNRWP